MSLRTGIFEMASGYGYGSLRSLARAMGVDVSTLSRVKRKEVGIGNDFVLGALRAFPDKRFDDLFEIVADEQPAETTTAA